MARSVGSSKPKVKYKNVVVCIVMKFPFCVFQYVLFCVQDEMFSVNCLVYSLQFPVCIALTVLSV